MHLENIKIEGKNILYLYVPEASHVVRCGGKIYDRNKEVDIDVTLQEEIVYQIYARKQSSYFVNQIYPAFSLEYLDSRLIERARKMTGIRSQNHPWKSMTDEEILRSSGLILSDSITGKEGITLAAILLFGKDSTIMSVLPQYKTDAIFRVKNLDRYDDREVVITNLLDSYDTLMQFAQKHLNDPFVLEGIQSVSARDVILREIISNLLAHRDFSSQYTAKLIIESKEMKTENGNRSHGFGRLKLENFEPFSKNPSISKVFREIGLADELGSGMRNTYKYTKLYSGGIPIFEEGDVFRTRIPLSEIVTQTIGPKEYKGIHDTIHDKLELLLEFCKHPKSREEIQRFLNLKNRSHVMKLYIQPLLEAEKLKMTLPEKPKSKYQKYEKK